MFLIRLFLIFVLWMLIRRFYRNIKAMKARSKAGENQNVGHKSGAQPEADYKDLTEQGIDDADFEEIP